MSDVKHTTGKWIEPNVPHKGWEYLGCEDKEETCEVCEMCEDRDIRYVHWVRHQDYPADLGVGNVCAENLCIEYSSPKAKERVAKNRTVRKKRFIRDGWSDTQTQGNKKKTWKENSILLFAKGRGFKLRINSQWGQKTYPDCKTAISAAFDVIDPPAFKKNP